MTGSDFWKGKRVFLTGHTGFKGSWLSLWLTSLGSRVTGYALAPFPAQNLHEDCAVDELLEKSFIADIRDRARLSEAMREANPDIVIHMAAQSLVRMSFEKPRETYETNVMGTVNLFEAVRACGNARAVVNVTSDKCYENREWFWSYREDEALGGYDPYSSSKACSELVTGSYRNAFFHPNAYSRHGAAVASARAGNVIGGGDWAEDRLVPDCVRALLAGETIVIRNPRAVRPWQHVLEPLGGYLLLAQRLYGEGAPFAQPWNFGPGEHDERPVEWIVEKLLETWGATSSWVEDRGPHPHEAHYLRLDSSKARALLGWRPRWNLEHALEKVVEWTKTYEQKGDLRHMCFKQIREYASGAETGVDG